MTDLVRELCSDAMLYINIPNFEKRFYVVKEVDKYRWKEDESVWKQKRGLAANTLELYLDGEFVCFIDDSYTVAQVTVEILEGLKKLFSQGKIFVNEEMYKIKAAEAEAKRKKDKIIEVDKATSPEEKIITEVLKRHARKRNKTVVTK